MHPAAPQEAEKQFVLAAGLIEAVREDRQAVRSEVAGGQMAFAMSVRRQGKVSPPAIPLR